jgi:hypothetical protein
MITSDYWQAKTVLARYPALLRSNQIRYPDLNAIIFQFSYRFGGRDYQALFRSAHPK